MDFYYAMTNYHIICCLLHKMCINKKNKGILYVSSYMKQNQPNIVNKIKESKIFDNVYFYDELEFKRTTKKMNTKELKIEINRICEEVDQTLGDVINNSNNIYLCSDFYSIGVYLVCKKINYNFFEDGCGTLSKKNLPLRIIEKDNPNRTNIIKKLKLLGENEFVVKRYGDLSAQEEEYYNQKDIDFSVEKLLKKLNGKQLESILNIYDLKKIDISNQKTNMLLTLHYNELFSIEEQKEIYLSLLDYFSKPREKVIIKPHPADSIMNYEKIIKGSKEINRYMPSELLPFCINKKLDKGITCWSTSIYGMKKIFKKIINFDEKIDSTYKEFDKYYSIVEYLKLVKKDNKVNIIYKDINEKQFERLFEEYFPNYKNYYTIRGNEKETIYIVNEITPDLEDKKVISLEYNNNSKNVIYINKKKIKNEEKKFISLFNMEYVQMNISKKLYYSKNSLNITCMKDNQQKEELFRIIKNQNKNIDNKIKKYEKEIANLEEIISKKNEHIQNLYNSTSWKITKPIRSLVDIVRKIKVK